MKKLLITLFLFCSLLGFCQVPNTTTFSLQDVVNNVSGASGNLSSCFSNAVSAKFDPAYNNDSYAPANSMLRFRNYGAFVTVYWEILTDPTVSIDQFTITKNGSTTMVSKTSSDGTYMSGSFTVPLYSTVEAVINNISGYANNNKSIQFRYNPEGVVLENGSNSSPTLGGFQHYMVTGDIATGIHLIMVVSS